MLLLIPVGVEYEAKRYPVVTFTLMGINVLLYLISLVIFFKFIDGDLEQRDWLAFNLGLIPAENVWWTYFTSMFVHAGFFHLLGNMIYLFLFGSCVEDTIGRWQFAVFYIVSGIIATVSYVVLEHDSVIPLVGASGAISACIGGFVVLLAKTKINFRYLFWFFYRLYNGEFMMPLTI
jgi:membrane associated rhomboid family serine protease